MQLEEGTLSAMAQDTQYDAFLCFFSNEMFVMKETLTKRQYCLTQVTTARSSIDATIEMARAGIQKSARTQAVHT